MHFADGRLATGPIAMVEVQGYVYDAWQRTAELCDALGEHTRATALRAQAANLKQAFDAAFWMPAEGHYALALDGQKRPVDSITSNPGHALWSGIVERHRAPLVASRLLADDLYSGWGVRTMASTMAAYNPLRRTALRFLVISLVTLAVTLLAAPPRGT